MFIGLNRLRFNEVRLVSRTSILAILAVIAFFIIIAICAFLAPAQLLRSEAVVTLIVGGAITALVGFGTYFLTIRRTARIEEERGRSARKDITSTLSRAIIQHGLNPSLEEVQMAINTKAREYGVSSGQISTPRDVLEDVYTRILETDYIQAEQKKKLLGTVSDMLRARQPIEAPRVPAEALAKSLSDIKMELAALRSAIPGEGSPQQLMEKVNTAALKAEFLIKELEADIFPKIKRRYAEEEFRRTQFRMYLAITLTAMLSIYSLLFLFYLR